MEVKGPCPTGVLSVNLSPWKQYQQFKLVCSIMFLSQNRKNDEVSYEKMLKLRRDLKKAL